MHWLLGIAGIVGAAASLEVRHEDFRLQLPLDACVVHPEALRRAELCAGIEPDLGARFRAEEPNLERDGLRLVAVAFVRDVLVMVLAGARVEGESLSTEALQQRVAGTAKGVADSRGMATFAAGEQPGSKFDTIRAGGTVGISYDIKNKSDPARSQRTIDLFGARATYSMAFMHASSERIREAANLLMKGVKLTPLDEGQRRTWFNRPSAYEQGRRLGYWWGSLLRNAFILLGVVALARWLRRRRRARP